MKFKFVITSLFSIALLAVVASAQHVQVFDATFNGGVFVGLTPVSATSGFVSGPNVRAVAGRTVRLRFAATNNQGILAMWGIPLSPDICSPTNPFSPAAAATQGRGLFTLSTDHTGSLEFEATTEVAWKGTCRILNVKLSDGSQHVGRVFFQ